MNCAFKIVLDLLHPTRQIQLILSIPESTWLDCFILAIRLQTSFSEAEKCNLENRARVERVKIKMHYQPVQ